MRFQKLLSLGNFFSVAHFYLIIYVLAPYLATFLPQAETGLVISAGALVSLAVFPFMPRLVRYAGAAKLALWLAIIQCILLALLGMSPGILPALLLVALSCAVSPLIAYQLDLLLEATVLWEGSTGRIRTAFLTAGNIALIFAPLAVGVLMDGTDAYWRVFLVAAASLLPFITLLLVAELPKGHAPASTHLWDTLRCVLADKDLRAVAFADMSLQFFYHLAPLYIPLYLHTQLGMPWSTLGWMFSIMLLPFVLLEFPAGWVADRFLGDKELMVVGFLIAGSAFAALSFIHSAAAIGPILIILILSRVGSALVEAMTEGHFFRRVSEEDANTVTLFRMMRPTAALAAPVLGSLLLIGAGYSVFFGVAGLIILCIGVASALAITDIR